MLRSAASFSCFFVSLRLDLLLFELANERTAAFALSTLVDRVLDTLRSDFFRLLLLLFDDDLAFDADGLRLLCALGE